jgi:hypothetical protein
MAITSKKMVEYKVPTDEILAALIDHYSVPVTQIIQKWGMDSDGQNFTFLFEDTAV